MIGGREVVVRLMLMCGIVAYSNIQQRKVYSTKYTAAHSSTQQHTAAHITQHTVPAHGTKHIS